MIRFWCNLLIVGSLVCVSSVVWAQQDPISWPSVEDEAIEIVFQVAKAVPQAFSLSREQNNQLDRVVRAMRNDRFKRANQIWFSLIQDILVKGGPLPNFDAMAHTVVRESFLEEDNELGQAADALQFENERLRIIREDIALLVARMQETHAQDEADRLLLEKMRREAEKQIAEQNVEKAEEALEQLANYYARLFDMVREMKRIWRATSGATLNVNLTP